MFIMEQKIIEYGFNLANQLKLFHWSTRSYSAHTALGNLYDKVSELTDELVECYMGTSGKTMPFFEINTLSHSDPTVSLKYIKDMILVLRKIRVEIKTSELQNIVDEMISAMDKTCYLLTLS